MAVTRINSIWRCAVDSEVFVGKHVVPNSQSLRAEWDCFRRKIRDLSAVLVTIQVSLYAVQSIGDCLSDGGLLKQGSAALRLKSQAVQVVDQLWWGFSFVGPGSNCHHRSRADGTERKQFA